MIKNGIKLTHNTFEYYELTISNKTTQEQINAKLKGFNQLNHEGEVYIVLSFQEDCCDILQIETLAKITQECAKSHNLEIRAIKSSLNITKNNISGLNIIGLPSLKKSKPLESKTLYIDYPVRSGVSIQNDGDIIVDNFVSNGAEIVATGNIHIYGELRGRVIAGSTGDKTAKIFVTKFNAQLIAVGGIYRAIDSKLPDNILNKFVMVSLDDKDKLKISPIITN